MQLVGLSLNPEQYQRLTRLINQDALEIAEVKSSFESQPDDRAIVMLAELLNKTFVETQDILDKL